MTDRHIDIPLIDLIPQRSPMVCVTHLISVGDDNAVSSFTIPSDFIFLHDEKMSEAGLLENAAQTVAARAGYLFLRNNEEVQRGFIVTFKNVKIATLPPAQSTIRTTVQLKYEALNMTSYEFISVCESEEIIRGEIAVVLES